uniref:Uncharacterized protein n=1 Tax=Cajanus cajan TaxID=3821 RepID=A0A151UDY2_CAJCA
MFQFTRLSLACPWIQQQFERLTYIGNPRIENRERRAFPPFPPDSLVLRMLVLRMSDCPSPTLTVQPESGQLMRSAY